MINFLVSSRFLGSQFLVLFLIFRGLLTFTPSRYFFKFNLIDPFPLVLLLFGFVGEVLIFLKFDFFQFLFPGNLVFPPLKFYFLIPLYLGFFLIPLFQFILFFHFFRLIFIFELIYFRIRFLQLFCFFLKILKGIQDSLNLIS